MGSISLSDPSVKSRTSICPLSESISGLKMSPGEISASLSSPPLKMEPESDGAEGDDASPPVVPVVPVVCAWVTEGAMATKHSNNIIVKKDLIWRDKVYTP